MHCRYCSILIFQRSYSLAPFVVDMTVEMEKLSSLEDTTVLGSFQLGIKCSKFGDSYKSPPEETGKSVTSKGFARKKERIVAITTEDMQKKRNDVKARTTLLLALPDEHQLRFGKYDNAKELWEAILKTFGGNEATKKTKKNQLKQQYGNFKAE
ncbi:hypothetical protein Tco_0251560 [Tanacetum coccineum]